MMPRIKEDQITDEPQEEENWDEKDEKMAGVLIEVGGRRDEPKITRAPTMEIMARKVLLALAGGPDNRINKSNNKENQIDDVNAENRNNEDFIKKAATPPEGINKVLLRKTENQERIDKSGFVLKPAKRIKESSCFIKKAAVPPKAPDNRGESEGAKGEEKNGEADADEEARGEEENRKAAEKFGGRKEMNEEKKKVRRCRRVKVEEEKWKERSCLVGAKPPAGCKAENQLRNEPAAVSPPMKTVSNQTR